MSPHDAALVSHVEELIRECRALCHESARICAESRDLVARCRQRLGKGGEILPPPPAVDVAGVLRDEE